MCNKKQYVSGIALIATFFYLAAIFGLIYYVKDIQIVYPTLLPIGLFLESNKEKFSKISPAFVIIGHLLLALFAIFLLGDLIYRIFIVNSGYYTPIFMTCLAVGLFLFSIALKCDE